MEPKWHVCLQLLSFLFTRELGQQVNKHTTQINRTCDAWTRVGKKGIPASEDVSLIGLYCIVIYTKCIRQTLLHTHM